VRATARAGRRAGGRAGGRAARARAARTAEVDECDHRDEAHRKDARVEVGHLQVVPQVLRRQQRIHGRVDHVDDKDVVTIVPADRVAARALHVDALAAVDGEGAGKLGRDQRDRQREEQRHDHHEREDVGAGRRADQLLVAVDPAAHPEEGDAHHAEHADLLVREQRLLDRVDRLPWQHARRLAVLAHQLPALIRGRLELGHRSRADLK
jgi:hypothetical protein